MARIDERTVDATSCTWGPGSSALDYNNYKLVVTKNGDSFEGLRRLPRASRPPYLITTVSAQDRFPSRPLKTKARP